MHAFRTAQGNGVSKKVFSGRGRWAAATRPQAVGEQWGQREMDRSYTGNETPEDLRVLLSIGPTTLLRLTERNAHGTCFLPLFVFTPPPPPPGGPPWTLR